MDGFWESIYKSAQYAKKAKKIYEYNSRRSSQNSPSSATPASLCKVKICPGLNYPHLNKIKPDWFFFEELADTLITCMYYTKLSLFISFGRQSELAMAARFPQVDNPIVERFTPFCHKPRKHDQTLWWNARFSSEVHYANLKVKALWELWEMETYNDTNKSWKPIIDSIHMGLIAHNQWM